jgi:hypothetical protein
LDSLLDVYARVTGSTDKLAELLRHAPSKRLFLNYEHWLQAINICLVSDDAVSAASVSESMVANRKQPPTAEQQCALMSALTAAAQWEAAASLLPALDTKYPSHVSPTAIIALLQPLAACDEVESLSAAEQAAAEAFASEGDSDTMQSSTNAWSKLGAFLRQLPADSMAGELGTLREGLLERYACVLGGVAPAAPLDVETPPASQVEDGEEAAADSKAM